MGIEETIKNIIEPHLFELKTSDRINHIRQDIADSLQVPFDSVKTTEWMDRINFVVDGKEYSIEIMILDASAEFVKNEHGNFLDYTEEAMKDSQYVL